MNYIKNRYIYYVLFGILILSSVFLYIDYNSFYVGRSLFRYKNVLPYDIQPIFRHKFEGGSSLMDKYGMPIISKYTKFEYANIEYEIQDIIKYTVLENETIITCVETTTNNIFYLEIIENHTDICDECFTIKVYETNEILFKKTKWYIF